MRTLLSPLLLLLSLSLAATNSLEEGTPNPEECTYELFVKTGTKENAGTSSVISLTLFGSDKGKDKFHIKNLASWGEVICPDHSYFQKGNLDAFRGTGTCLPSPPCLMLLNSDVSGEKPDWYVDYVDLTTVAPDMATGAFQHFDFSMWLSPGAPSAFVNNC